MQLRVLFAEPQDSPYLFQDDEQLPPVCFRVTWNRYYDTGTERIDCPPGAQRIEPPVNTSTVFVIPADAGDVAQAVLRELPAAPLWFGRQLSELEAALGVRIAYLTRFGEGILPAADTRYQEGDELHAMLAVDRLTQIDRLLATAPAKAAALRAEQEEEK